MYSAQIIGTIHTISLNGMQVPAIIDLFLLYIR